MLFKSYPHTNHKAIKFVKLRVSMWIIRRKNFFNFSLLPVARLNCYNFIDLFYKMFCPILFLVINSVHICKEWVQTPKVNFRLVCDTVLYVALFVILWFYFFEIHSKITNWCKMHIPGIKFIADKLRKLLKEV